MIDHVADESPPTRDLPLPARSRSQVAADAAGRVVEAARRLVHARRRDSLPRATERVLLDELAAAVAIYEVAR